MRSAIVASPWDSADARITPGRRPELQPNRARPSVGLGEPASQRAPVQLSPRSAAVWSRAARNSLSALQLGQSCELARRSTDGVKQRGVRGHAGEVPVGRIFVGRLVVHGRGVILRPRFGAGDAAVHQILAGAEAERRHADFGESEMVGADRSRRSPGADRACSGGRASRLPRRACRAGRTSGCRGP